MQVLKKAYIVKQAYFTTLVSYIGEDYLREILEIQIESIEKMFGMQSATKLEEEISLLKQKLILLEGRKNSLP